jgi:hypothetical protein
LQKTKDFYSQILRLDVSESYDGRLLEIYIDGRSTILIYSKVNPIPATFTILNFTGENLDQIIDDLTLRGVHFEVYNEDNVKTDEKDVSLIGRSEDHLVYRPCP